MPLTDAKIKSLKPRDKAYKVADFDGLYINVAKSGARLNGRSHRGHRASSRAHRQTRSSAALGGGAARAPTTTVIPVPSRRDGVGPHGVPDARRASDPGRGPLARGVESESPALAGNETRAACANGVRALRVASGVGVGRVGGGGAPPPPPAEASARDANERGSRFVRHVPNARGESAGGSPRSPSGAGVMGNVTPGASGRDGSAMKNGVRGGGGDIAGVGGSARGEVRRRGARAFLKYDERAQREKFKQT